MDIFLEDLDRQANQDTLHRQRIEECYTCDLDRFQQILEGLPSEWRLSAVHAAIRHSNKPLVKWYLNESPRAIPEVLLYACQLNITDLVLYMSEYVFVHKLQDLLTHEEKYSCVWWSFHYQNVKVTAALLIYLHLRDPLDSFVQKDFERKTAMKTY